jgi:hypothetical protein
MTQPPPSARTAPPSAREVAKHLDRRRMKRKLAGGASLAALAALAATYLTCGRDFGLAGGGYRLDEGDGDAPGSARVDTPPARCALRVTATGIVVNGAPAKRDDAVATCKAAGGADVVVTGAAREGDWKDLRAALEAAGVTFSVR